MEKLHKRNILRFVYLISLPFERNLLSINKVIINSVFYIFALSFILLNIQSDISRADVFNVPANDTAALIQAVSDSTGTLGPDDINLGGGTYTLNSPLELINLTINGNNSTIEGGVENNPCDGIGNEFSVLITRSIGINGGPVILNDLTVRRGCANIGGGILNEGNLTLNNVRVTENGFKFHGGGIGNTIESTVTINNSEISENIASPNFDDPPPFGAGISNFGTININNSDIIDNIANDGGGIYNDDEITIINSNISGNIAQNDSGGGIFNDGFLTISNSNISDNNAMDHGGGIYNSLVSNIVNTIILGNDAQNETGGGISNIGLNLGNLNTIASLGITNTIIVNNSAGTNGGGLFNSESLFLRECSVIGNTSNQNGGGIYTSRGYSMVNTTISNNVATSGGGVYLDNTSSSGVNVDNCTITENSDGLFNVNLEASFRLRNSIAAENDGPDCTGPTISLGYNIDSDNSCDLDETGDQPNTDPLLGPLANNGGPTPTHGLLNGSPAINMGNPAGCFDSTRESISTMDQRNFPRPVGGVCDIGAFELQAGEVVDDGDGGGGGNGFDAGDANGDGIINGLDITATVNAVLEINMVSGNADCNEDGIVNGLDITCVVNKVLEI